MPAVNVLASDMDGTFIPLEGNQENRRDLEQLTDELQRHEVELVYVTGRHYELVLDAIQAYSLPNPRWLICDVGTSIYESPVASDHQLLQAYVTQLKDLVGEFDVAKLADLFSGIDALRLQEPQKQGQFKLSYYCDADLLDEISKRLSQLLDQGDAPYRIIASVDPFTGDGLVDCLPRGVSKAHALSWWVKHAGHDCERVVFAGDSGNDLAALTAGYRSIVVGNADRSVAEQASRAHQMAGWTDRLFIAAKPATSGVLQGLRHFIQQ